MEVGRIGLVEEAEVVGIDAEAGMGRVEQQEQVRLEESKSDSESGNENRSVVVTVIVIGFLNPGICYRRWRCCTVFALADCGFCYHFHLVYSSSSSAGRKTLTSHSMSHLPRCHR